MKKGVVYEVKLLDWIEREDIDGDKIFIKQWIAKPTLKEYEKPKDIDEVYFNVRIYQKGNNDEEIVLFERNDWNTSLADPELTYMFQKILTSMKATEKNFVELGSEVYKERDPELYAKLEE